nr:hypothetical protein [Paenibacillus larvae]
MRKIADDSDRIGNSSKQVYLQKAGDKLSDEKLQEMLCRNVCPKMKLLNTACVMLFRKLIRWLHL